MELLSNIADAFNSPNCTNRIAELINSTEVKTDNNRNIIAHIGGGGSGTKIMISAIADIDRVIITSVKENSAEFELLGTLKSTSASDREVFKNGGSAGIVRSKYKDDKLESQKIELWDKNLVKSGDILAFDSKVNCKGDKLYGQNLSQAIACKIAVCLTNQISSPVNDLYFTLSFSDKSAKAAAQSVKPDFIFPVYCAEETDDFKISNGCGIVYKDGNAVCEPWVRDIVTGCAADAQIKFQPYIGKCTTLTEQLSITGEGPAVCGICIPAKHINSACHIASSDDIQCAQELIESLLNYKY